jgi:IS1 family transposase
MVTVLASSAVDHGFGPRSGQTIDYKIGMCCFSTKHATLRIKSKDSLARIRILRPSRATCLSATVVSVS